MAVAPTWLSGELTELQRARVRLLENREWIDRNIAELQRDHANQWIAVLDCSIAAVSGDYGKVLDTIRSRLEEAAIMRIPAGEIARPI